ncbi:DUF423 domain-containing protein [Flavobacteriaceae bacterium]|nr:DUF423 domain-containing protein [Flavobacteriaceae bacterium]
MKIKMRFFGSLFMVLGMVLGALGSHYLKKILSAEALDSFEVGLRYLIYQGLGLFFLSSIDFTTSKIKKYIFYLILWGTIAFSGSIFILSFKSQFSFSLAWIGPITPLGGTALIIAWILTTREFIKRPFT